MRKNVEEINVVSERAQFANDYFYELVAKKLYICESLQNFRDNLRTWYEKRAN